MSAQIQPGYRVLSVNDKTHMLLDADVYERAAHMRWRRHDNSIETTVNGTVITIGQFVMGLEPHSSQKVIRKARALRHMPPGVTHDFTRNNLMVTQRGQEESFSAGNPPVSPAVTQPATKVDPAPVAGTLTPKPAPKFIDINGRGLIVNVDDIAAIDTSDPDIVTVERRTQQWNQAGRDTCAITYAFEGDEARYVRAWATTLTDPTGLKLIDLALEAERATHASADLRTECAQWRGRAEAAEGKINTLTKKLGAVGFDINKLLAS